MNTPRYFDYMASTPIAPEVASIMQEILTSNIAGNPASTHIYGDTANQAITQATSQVAAAIGSLEEEIIWTSGATEANNLAIKGLVNFYHRKGKHIITTACSHKSLLSCCAWLENQGHEVTYLNPQANGLINLTDLQQALRKDTVLVSVTQVNNETGIIQNIADIADIVKPNGTLLHVDAAQSIGKIAVDIKSIPVDAMTFSAHKAYGPIGVGALYIRSTPKLRLTPQIHGGGQQQDLRGGTMPTHQIAGMGKAFELATTDLQQEQHRIIQLRDQLWQGLQLLDRVSLNGDLQHQVPQCLNVAFGGVNAEALLLATRHLALSTGSACNSALNQPSHVLLSMGLSHTQASQSVRISLGRYTSEEDIAEALRQFSTALKRLRQLAPN